MRSRLLNARTIPFHFAVRGTRIAGILSNMSRYCIDNSWEALSHPERAAAFFLVDSMPPLPTPTVEPVTEEWSVYLPWATRGDG